MPQLDLNTILLIVYILGYIFTSWYQLKRINELEKSREDIKVISDQIKSYADMIKVDELRKHWDIRESNLRAEHKVEMNNLRAEHKEEIKQWIVTYTDKLENIVETYSNLNKLIEHTAEAAEALKDENVIENLKKLRGRLPPGAQ